MPINYADLKLKFFGALAPLGDAGGTGGTAEVLLDSRFSTGTGANQCDRMYHDTRTLTGSANEDLDLTTLLDANGVAIALVDVTLIIIEAASTNAGTIDVAPGAANGFDLIWDGTSPLLHLLPGATVMFECPTDPAWVVDGTHKVLNFLNLVGTSVDYTLTVCGRSA